VGGARTQNTTAVLLQTRASDHAGLDGGRPGGVCRIERACGAGAPCAQNASSKATSPPMATW